MNNRLAAAGLLVMVLAVCARALDVPGDEATNRKLLSLWKNDSEKLDHLRARVLAFRALPADEQVRLRNLDRQLHELNPNAQSRLRSVMERYVGWRSRLSTVERRRLDAAPPGPERVRVVEELLDRQWQRSLPHADQERLAKANDDERAKLLAQFRKDADDRQRLRLDARRAVEEAAALGGSRFAEPDFRERVRTYIDESLRPLLTPVEDARLALATPVVRSDEGKGGRGGSWFRSVSTVKELSDGRSPLPFPGPAPPGRAKAVRSIADLPDDFRPRLRPLPPDVLAAEGKWPQFALAVQAHARSRKVEMPANTLGPTKPDELPPTVQKFLREELTDQLTDAERAALAAAEGRWPDYPKKVKELADLHSLRVPGIALPGTEELWQRAIRMSKPKTAGAERE